MHLLRKMLLPLIMLLLLCQSALAADFSKLVILHTNDTHGYDEYGDGHNGMAVIASLKEKLESEGYQVLLLDAGDAIQDNNLVNFSEGKSAIQFMNAARYDAATLGNHEFDYGQDILRERMSEALFPYVAANIRIEANGKNFIRPYTIVQKSDLKIGILGLTTPQTITSTSPKNVRGLTFLQGRELWQSASLGQVIGKSLVALDGSRAPGVRTMETNSGDFCADAVLWQAAQANVLNGTVDAAICNGGGIRSGIAPGDITRSMLYSMNPYNNQLCVVKITGSKLLEILEAATAYTPEAMGSFPQVAGISYTINTAVAYSKGEQYPNSGYYAPALPGSRVTIESVGNCPFQPEAVYSIAMIDFLASGGDTYAGLCLPGAKLDYHSIGYLDAEALENYLTEKLHGVIGMEYREAQARITIR